MTVYKIDLPVIMVTTFSVTCLAVLCAEKLTSFVAAEVADTDNYYEEMMMCLMLHWNKNKSNKSGCRISEGRSAGKA